MSNTSIWKVVVSAALALIFICIVQGYWLQNTFDQSEKAFEEKVHIALRNVAKQVSELKKVQLPSYDLINQISQDYYIVNIRDAIDARNLEFYLLKEFESIGLQTDFEYGIYDCDTDQMVYGNYISSQEEYSKPHSRSFEIPEQNDYVYYFGVRFPERKGYILNSQWLPLLFTVILMLAVLFFIYATFEILRQKKLSDLQKDFINNMTHEFKTPLSSIKISSEVFLQHPEILRDTRLLRYAGIINDQATRLDEQVERVLQIAGLQKGKIVLHKELTNVRILVDEMIMQLKSRCEKDGVTLMSSFVGQHFSVLADPHHLTNILYNLVDNAFKYKKDAAKIHITIAPGSSGLQLSVADNGIGIEKLHLSKVDHKFYRVPTGNIHNAKGFGLGLHYVRQIVDAHGWTMEIKSEPGQGTEVCLIMQNHHS